MVSFQCHVCGDIVKKPKLDQHRGRCGSGFDCIDCSKTFNTPGEYKSHTSCISEAEKYQKSLYKGPRKNGSMHHNGPPHQSQYQQKNGNSGRNGYAYGYGGSRSMGSGANNTPLGTPRRVSPVEKPPLPDPQSSENMPRDGQKGQEKRKAEEAATQEPPTKKTKTDESTKEKKKKSKADAESSIIHNVNGHSAAVPAEETPDKNTKTGAAASTVEDPKETKKRRKAEKKALKEPVKENTNAGPDQNVGIETPEEARARVKAEKKDLKKAAREAQSKSTKAGEMDVPSVLDSERTGTKYNDSVKAEPDQTIDTETLEEVEARRKAEKKAKKASKKATKEAKAELGKSGGMNEGTVEKVEEAENRVAEAGDTDERAKKKAEKKAKKREAVALAMASEANGTEKKKRKKDKDSLAA